MKVVVYSTHKAEEQNIAWHRAGANIVYFANGIRKSSRSKRCLYTLRFSYTFEYDKDTVYFAYSYPYSYSQLTEFLNKLEADHAINE